MADEFTIGHNSDLPRNRRSHRWLTAFLEDGRDVDRLERLHRKLTCERERATLGTARASFSINTASGAMRSVPLRIAARVSSTWRRPLRRRSSRRKRASSSVHVVPPVGKAHAHAGNCRACEESTSPAEPYAGWRSDTHGRRCRARRSKMRHALRCPSVDTGPMPEPFKTEEDTIDLHEPTEAMQNQSARRSQGTSLGMAPIEARQPASPIIRAPKEDDR